MIYKEMRYLFNVILNTILNIKQTKIHDRYSFTNIYMYMQLNDITHAKYTHYF